MNLSVLLPFKILAKFEEVTQIVAQTLEGSIGLLPQRLDCVAALVPGILSYSTARNGTSYLAIDEGVLVKSGDDVRVSVRRGITGRSLGELHEAVVREFLTLDAQERESRLVVAKMESALISAELRRER
jgi:F-type H+-transporting ATPase subunit epsilon